MGWGNSTQISIGTFKRIVVALMALAVLLAACSCGGSGGGTGATVSVTLTPATTTLTPSSTLQFAATVTGATDERVTWAASAGTISDTGFFTAPTAVGTYTVTATSVADTTKSATSTVTVATATGVTVVVTPQTVTVAPNGNVQFTATVTGTANHQVTWTTSAGSINSAGFLTAPTTAQVLTVTATSVAQPTASAFSRVTVSNSAPVINLTPIGITLPTNATQQFTATVSNVSDHSVTWTATGGTISTDGLYQAGHTTGSFKVTATSNADHTTTASSNVTITSIGVTVTPNGANLVAGSTQQFTALVSGTGNLNVTWSTNRGSISPSGLLTVPLSSGNVTVTATSVADTTVSGSATNAVVDASDFVYDFESGAPGVWSPTTTEVTPVGARKFLGRYSGTNAATLTLSSLTNHSGGLTLTFDLFVIGGWTGADASSKFTVNATGSTKTFSQTFSNILADNQTYPDGGSNAPGTSSTEKNTLGYTHNPDILYKDTVYHITLNLTDHRANEVTIKFLANLTGTVSDQSWGIDNVHVHANP